jgi:hypothetical protein
MDYKIKIIEDLSLSTLEGIWKSIEQISKQSYFLSWSWVETWLLTYRPKFIAVLADYDGVTVAIGLFTLSSCKRHQIINSRQLRLLQTGTKNQDQIWIEYNDFIADPTHRVNAINRSLQKLSDTYIGWDELVISMTDAKHLNEYKLAGTKSTLLDRKPTYLIDLSLIKGKCYLETLSKNSRYQIRRSIREYESSYGELRLIKADSKDEALVFLKTAGIAHKKRWSGSGFHNDDFTNFHEKLIRNKFEDGNIDLIKLVAGEEVVGLVYNFIYQKQIFFYLSGLNYGESKKLKPGLVLHSMLIQYYLDRGYDVYNLMGGESRYKKTLAAQSIDLISICYQRKRLAFTLENFARNLKSRCQNMLTQN